MSDDDNLDMTFILEDIEALRTLIVSLEGEEVNVEVANHRSLMARKAEVNRKLLLAAHEADAIRVGIMSEYHHFKGGVEGRSRR